jgi:hypothetical protein
MGDRQETVTYTVAGNLEAKLKDATKAVEDLGKTFEDQGKKTTKSAQQTVSFTDNLNKAKVAIAALSGAVKETITAFAEQDALTGQLSRSFGKLTGSLEGMDRQLENITENSKEFGVNANEQIIAYKNLLSGSRDVTKASEDLSLAIDIQAQEELSLTAATKILTKARLGDVGALKSLGVFSKEFIKDLSKITDETERSEIAMQALSEEYKGAATDNLGLADSLSSTEQALSAMGVATGSVVVALAEAGQGMLEWITFSEDGELGLRNIAAAFTNFATAIGNTTTGIGQFVDGLQELGPGGVWDAAVFGRPDVLIDRVRVAGVKAGVAAGEGFKEGAMSVAEDPEALFSSAAGGTAEERLAVSEARQQREKDAKAAAKEREKEAKAAAAKAKAANAKRVSEALKAEQEQLKGIALARKEFADKQKEQEGRDFRDRLARLKLAGEERAALELALEGSGATEGETDLALTRFDEQQERLAAEIELREKIAQLKAEGMDLEAEFLQIESQSLTLTEEKLAKEEASASAQADLAKANVEAANAGKAAITGVLALTGQQEAAKRAGAAIDALVFQYQAIGMFGAGNIPGGIQLQVAAISAGAVAAGAGGGGGGAKGASGGASAPSGSPAGQARSALIDSDTRSNALSSELPSINIEINARSLSKLTPREARSVVDDTLDELTTRLRI